MGFTHSEYLAAWDFWKNAWKNDRVVGRVSSVSLVGRVIFDAPATPVIPGTPVNAVNPIARPARAADTAPAGLRTYAVTTTTYYIPADAPAFLNMPAPDAAHPSP